MKRVAMRREAAYRVWTACVGIAACASGIVLWQHGQRFVGGLGLATALLHALWAIDVRAMTRGRWQRRPVVIPQLHDDPFVARAIAIARAEVANGDESPDAT